MSDGKPSVFSKYVEHGPKKERPEPEIPRGPLLQPIVPPTDYKSPPIERLLDLTHEPLGQTNRNSARNIRQYGPRSLRDRKSAWGLGRNPGRERLARPPSNRTDTTEHEWQIIRGPKSRKTRLQPQSPILRALIDLPSSELSIHRALELSSHRSIEPSTSRSTELAVYWAHGRTVQPWPT